MMLRLQREILVLALVACGDVDAAGDGVQLAVECHGDGWVACTTQAAAYDADMREIPIAAYEYTKLPAGEHVVVVDDEGRCHFWCEQ